MIHVGAGALATAGAILAGAVPARRTVVVTDENVAALHLDALRASLDAAGFAADAVVLPPGEATKSLASAAGLYDRLAAFGADRGTPVAALGGGVVTDLAGFAAATWLRGVPWLAVPTTLIGQVDAAVGGKTGVNLPAGKNLVGAFHQPVAVVADPMVLGTLPEREFRAGLGEAVKIGLGLDAALFEELESAAGRLHPGDAADLAGIVAACVRQKARIVSADEREGGLRRLLNLGHTAGHAIEAAAGYGPVLHGEAVAAGLVAACRIAERRGRLDPGATRRTIALLARFGLPSGPADLPVALDPERVAAHLGADKKRKDGRLALVLPTGIGTSEIVEDGDPAEVIAALFAPPA